MKLLSSQEAAEIAQMSPRGIQIACQRGKLNGSKIGGSWVISELALKLYMEGESYKQPGRRPKQEN